MTSAVSFEAGNFRFLSGSLQFSGGVAASQDFRIVRVRFSRLLPLARGFDVIADILAQAGRPLTALCACELRSPEPLDDAGFASFNQIYVATLKSWGFDRAGAMPVARSNVCPLISPPAEPSFFAFAYTEAAIGTQPSYILSGCAEARSGPEPYVDRIVRYGDVSTIGLQAKARFVRETVDDRAAALGASLAGLTDAQVYSAHNMHEIMTPEYIPTAALHQGVTWQLCRPPVIGLEYELDTRSVEIERIVWVK